MTSHMGNTYYYFTRGNAKRHGKAHCDQSHPWLSLECSVADTAIKVIFSDKIIGRNGEIFGLRSPAEGEYPAACPERPAQDDREAAGKPSEAIEQGILTPTTSMSDESEAREVEVP